MTDSKRKQGIVSFIKAVFSGKTKREIDTEIENLLVTVEKITKREFKDHRLVKRALTHKSSRLADEKNNYERMEFLGDAVLGTVISDLLYTTYHDEDEGRLTYYKDSLIQMRSLAAKARELGLGDYVIVGNKEKRNGFSNSDVLLGDIFESLIGAIYLDMGFEGAFGFIRRLFEKDVEFIKDQPEWDFKSKLNNISQLRYKSPPDYTIVEEHYSHGVKTYRVTVALNNSVIAYGEARNKKEAEQNAAKKALQRLQNRPPAPQRMQPRTPPRNPPKPPVEKQGV